MAWVVFASLSYTVGALVGLLDTGLSLPARLVAVLTSAILASAASVFQVYRPTMARRMERNSALLDIVFQKICADYKKRNPGRYDLRCNVRTVKWNAQLMGRPEGVPWWKPLFRTLAVSYHDERFGGAERRNEFLMGQGLCGLVFEKKTVDYFDKVSRSGVEQRMTDIQIALTRNVRSILCVPVYRRSVPFRTSPIAVFCLDSSAPVSVTRFGDPDLQRFVTERCHLVEEVLD
jgi:hypothetical protein